MLRRKKIWVAALKSGEYKQCQQFLAIEGKYCCLGVALLVNHNLETTFDGHFDAEDVSDWCNLLRDDHLTYEVIDTLAKMNDSGSSFNEIADWIEENL